MRNKSVSFLEMLEYYFKIYLPTAKGLADSTIKSYKTVFRLFIEYLFSKKGIKAGQISFVMLDTATIAGFLDWLENERGCSITTRNHRLSALTAFADYAQNRDFEAATIFRTSISKVPRKKGKKSKRSFFSREELKVLFNLPSASEIGVRDKTLLCFMYASGARAQEVCDLTVGAVQFYSDRASVNIIGKGQKVRRIGIPKQASDILRKYIEHRKISIGKGKHIFSSQTHEKMSVSCIEEIFAKYIVRGKAEYPHLFQEEAYTPHSMRHTTACHMLESGVSMIVVKNFLGHASLQTTQIYAEITQDTMNRHLKSWNDKWFIKEAELDIEDADERMPEFLK